MRPDVYHFAVLADRSRTRGAGRFDTRPSPYTSLFHFAGKLLVPFIDLRPSFDEMDVWKGIGRCSRIEFIR
jgi:hypothetical protein